VIVEAFVGLGQQSPGPVERIGFAAPMAEGVVCTRRRHSSSLVLPCSRWNGSATWAASGTVSSKVCGRAGQVEHSPVDGVFPLLSLGANPR
jgi:hypothetical protein